MRQTIFKASGGQFIVESKFVTVNNVIIGRVVTAKHTVIKKHAWNAFILLSLCLICKGSPVRICLAWWFATRNMRKKIRIVSEIGMIAIDVQAALIMSASHDPTFEVAVLLPEKLKEFVE